MSNNIDEHNKVFAQIIERMREDLQYLVNNTKVSKTFIRKQNHILKTLIAYFNEVNKYISFLESENTELRIERMNERERLHDRIISFEAICIIHGIIDFPMWLSMGKTFLVLEAVELGKANKIRLTDKLNEKIKNMPAGDRQALEVILFKEVDQEIKMLLSEINQKRKKHTK